MIIWYYLNYFKGLSDKESISQLFAYYNPSKELTLIALSSSFFLAGLFTKQSKKYQLSDAVSYAFPFCCGLLGYLQH